MDHNQYRGKDQEEERTWEEFSLPWHVVERLELVEHLCAFLGLGPLGGLLRLLEEHALSIVFCHHGVRMEL